MSGRRVTSWTLTASAGTITQVFVGDLLDAETWAALVTGGAPYLLLGADGQRSELLAAPPARPELRARFC